ncbi:MAG: hypothetical protein NPIRA06_15650 [Nitrospirales bacterium]|nr:MAG: hypothetical protein NPIRA06_15650 [Nitrospirales bacterium]
MQRAYLISSGVIGCFFCLMLQVLSAAAEVKPSVQPPNEKDDRTEILLPASGQILILREMRQMLMATQAVITGLSLDDMSLVERSARSAGVSMAADIDPAVREKLPQTFRGIGMSVHRDFDALADGIVERETVQQILTRLSSLMSRCITCHENYRLSSR